MGEQVLSRRSGLKYLGLIAGTAAGQAFLAQWLPASTSEAAHSGPMPGMAAVPPAPASAPYTPQFFKPEEFETVSLLSEMIIPADETPGARQARVADYIDFIVYSAAEFEPSLEARWTAGLGRLDRESREKFGNPFRKLPAAAREKLMEAMSLPERDAHARHPNFEFYRLLKGMTVEGFYSSRVGLVDVLGYQGLTYLADFPGCTHSEHH